MGETLAPERHYLPSHLCIDEFKSVKNVSDAMSFIFMNAVNHEVIDIVENRQQHYLSDYFMRERTPAGKDGHDGYVFALYRAD